MEPRYVSVSSGPCKSLAPFLLAMLVLQCNGDYTCQPTDPTCPQHVGPAGGTIHSADGVVTLVIPSGSVSQNTTITISATTAFPSNPTVISRTVYEFGPSGTQFAQPVQIAIKYDPSGIPPGIQPTSLRLSKVSGSAWVEVPASNVDGTANTVSGFVTSFSTYGVTVGLSTTTCLSTGFSLVWPICGNIGVGSTQAYGELND